jgi:nicotinamidase/pyrazinamidase
MGKAGLIVVDIQKDFFSGGALAIPKAEQIIPLINKYIESLGALVFYSRDYHPYNHSSFKEYGGQWDPHCVIGTRGVLFHDNLYFPKVYWVIDKGIYINKEAYSAFEGVVTPNKVSLNDVLSVYDVDTLYVCGVATDYCVKATVLDALKYGYDTYILLNAIRGVHAEFSIAALGEMYNAGAKWFSRWF